jgi:hypothetical protein
MARKRTDWDEGTWGKFRAMVNAGLSANEIASKLTAEGVPGASPATVGRRAREILGARQSRGPVAPSAPVAAPPSPASTPVVEAVEESLEDVPEDPAELEGAPADQLKRWLSRVERAAAAAEKHGNLAVVAALTARATALLEAQRKAAPPPARDPNESLDMVQAAELARTKLRTTLDNIIGNRGKY